MVDLTPNAKFRPKELKPATISPKPKLPVSLPHGESFTGIPYMCPKEDTTMGIVLGVLEVLATAVVASIMWVSDLCQGR